MLLEPLRWLVGQAVLGFEKLTSPEPPERTPSQQALLDAQTTGLALYEFLSCPFCVKVRKVIRGKGLTIERRDARRNRAWGDELRREGGRFQVPCLKMTDSSGNVRWLYESDAIIDWLEQQFPQE